MQRKRSKKASSTLKSRKAKLAKTLRKSKSKSKPRKAKTTKHRALREVPIKDFEQVEVHNGIGADEMVAEALAEDRDDMKSPAAEAAALSVREDTLATAVLLISGAREEAYGDPLDNFCAVSQLKEIFWRFFNRATFNTIPSIELSSSDIEGEKRLGRNSPHGHAIDMILTNLARIATQPSSAPSADRYVDIAGYAALAHEVAERS